MSGTTLCPHCDTRFKIAEAQLEAHHGMVRCGYCLQAFDARPNFVPDQPDPQLELPMLDEPAGAITSADEAVIDQSEPPDLPHNETLDFSQPIAAPVEPENVAQQTAPRPSEIVVLQPMTLAEQVAIVQDEDDSAAQPKRRNWPWAIAALLLLLVLLAQAAYFFRIELAARLPGIKPALTGYCRMLGCDVPLPRNTDLMGIESSDLEADPAQASLITLNALLRNRATYTQAFPNLELTLNDTSDKPLARRVFRPADYLPPVENEQTGLLPNHELSIKLHLNTTDLKPTGYQLVLFYSNS